MANKKQALKYIRKTEVRRVQNKSMQSRLKSLTRKARELADSDDSESRKKVAGEMISAYDKASKRGIVHPNKVSRMKSSVSSYLG